MTQVTERQSFLTVDDIEQEVRLIADASSGLARWRRAGESRLGREINMIQVGSGKKNALIFAMAHADEPIGAITALELAHALCKNSELRDSLDYTWFILPCVDPDATQLNRNWFSGPFDRRSRAPHFFRPAASSQVEFTFPFSTGESYFDQSLPETLILIELINELKPALIASLHNQEDGGCFFILSEAAESLQRRMVECIDLAGLPRDLRSSAAEEHIPIAPGFCRLPTGEELFRTVLSSQEMGGPLPHGTSAGDYARKFGTFCVIPEAPLWINPRASAVRKLSKSAGTISRELGEEGCQTVHEIVGIYDAVADDLTLTSSPVSQAARGFPEICDIHFTGWLSGPIEGSDSLVTEAELFSYQSCLRIMQSRMAGMLCRALATEVAVGNGTRSIRRARDLAEGLLDDLCDKAERDNPSTVSIEISRSVAVQLGAVLASAEYVQR